MIAKWTVMREKPLLVWIQHTPADERKGYRTALEIMGDIMSWADGDCSVLHKEYKQSLQNSTPSWFSRDFWGDAFERAFPITHRVSVYINRMRKEVKGGYFQTYLNVKFHGHRLGDRMPLVEMYIWINDRGTITDTSGNFDNQRIY